MERNYSAGGLRSERLKVDLTVLKFTPTCDSFYDSMHEFEHGWAPGLSAQPYIDLRYVESSSVTTCRSGGGLYLLDCHQVGSPVASSLEPAASAGSPSLQSALKALDQQVDALRKRDNSAPFKPTWSLRMGEGGVMGDRSQTEDTLDEPGSIHKVHARDDGHDVVPEVHEDEPADPAVPVRRDEGLAQPAHRRGMPVRSVGDDAPIAKAHESMNSFMHSIVGPSAFFMQQGLHAHGESLRSKADDASTGFSMPWCTLPSDTDGETDNAAAPGSDGQGEPAASAGSPSLQSVLKELDQQLDALRKRSNSSLVEPVIGSTLGTGEDGVMWESSHTADMQSDERAENSDHDTSALQHVTRCEAEEGSGDQVLQHHSASAEANSLRSVMSAGRESTPTTLPCRALAPLPLLDLGSVQSQTDRERDADENALRLHLLTTTGKAAEEMSCGWREGPHSQDQDAFFVVDWLKQLQDPQRRQRVSDMLHRSNH